MAFEQVFKQIDDKLRVDEGCATALDYVEQSSWILFLKYLDDLDQTREQSALLTGEDYRPIIDYEYSLHLSESTGIRNTFFGFQERLYE